MNASRIGGVVLRQFYLYRGSPQRVLPIFAWVAIDIVLWGFITRFLSRISAPGFHIVPALLGAVLLWDFLTRVMQGVTMAFFEDVWSRNFLNIFATPLRISEYLSGLVATSTQPPGPTAIPSYVDKLLLGAALSRWTSSLPPRLCGHSRSAPRLRRSTVRACSVTAQNVKEA